MALLAIADALHGHPSLTEISVANQRKPLPTDAIERLLSAMEATPTVLHLGLGTLRDDAVRKRQQPEVARLVQEPLDRKSTRLNSSHAQLSRMPSSA
jgi:hypothetical protein